MLGSAKNLSFIVISKTYLRRTLPRASISALAMDGRGLIVERPRIEARITSNIFKIELCLFLVLHST